MDYVKRLLIFSGSEILDFLSFECFAQFGGTYFKDLDFAVENPLSQGENQMFFTRFC